MCVGVDLCNKKNCLENERCVLYEPRHISPCEVRHGPKKRKKKKLKAEALLCPGKSRCNKKNICQILGECILDHSLINGNADFCFKLAKSTSILTVLKIFNKLKPPVTLRGQLKNYKRPK